MAVYGGADGRFKQGYAPWILVLVRDESLLAMEAHRNLSELLEAAREAKRLAFNVPFNTSTGLLGDGPIEDRARHVRRAADQVPERFMEVDTARAYAALARFVGKPQGFEHDRPTAEGLRERLEALHAVGLRPRRSFGGIGLVEPKTVVDATVLAWMAGRKPSAIAQDAAVTE